MFCRISTYFVPRDKRDRITVFKEHASDVSRVPKWIDNIQSASIKKKCNSTSTKFLFNFVLHYNSDNYKQQQQKCKKKRKT